MVIENGDTVEFKITSEDLIASISLLRDMREYMLTLPEHTDGMKETAKALLTATETMSAFWCTHFGEDEEE